MHPLLQDATEAQREAIQHLEGPLLVLAGPGSGKTRVVTRRIAWLVEQGVPPDNILAITFTNKAAEEMRERVSVLLARAPGLWVSTFHSMGARMLRRSGDRIGIERSFTIYDQQDQTRILREILKDLNVDATRFKPAAIASSISRLKSDLITPARAASKAFDFASEVVAKAYPVYERRLRDSNGLDFDDLLVKNLKLLEKSVEAREHYQRRFRFVLVDEYQDTNRVQFLLLRHLAAPEGNIHVTGDPDQSIYRFRGADIRNILDFEKDYPRARTLRLEENFRSTKFILSGADSLIRKNRERKSKRLFTNRDGGRRIVVETCYDEEQEGRLVAERVAEALDRGVSHSEMAVFYRVHALSRSLERAFIERGIPYQIVRGTEFFRRAEVQDLLAYLKVIANPRDSESLLRIINVPARGIGNTTRDRLRAFALHNDLPLPAAIHRYREVETIGSRGRSAVAKLSELFLYLKERAEGPLAILLEELIRAISFSDHLRTKHPDNHEDRWENVAQLVSSTAEFEEKNPGAGLSGYLEEVSLLSDADGADPDSSRVAFMTLHTAKGLEFKNVYIVGLEEGLLPHSRSRDSAKEMEEERRLLFVGMTRAMEELTLTHARERFQWGQQSFSRPSCFLSEIDPDAIDEAGDPVVAERPHYEVDPWVEAAPDVAASEGALATGMLVKHSHFGVGRVLELSGSGPSTRVTVDFLNHGRKKLVLMYAKLSAVEEGPW